MDPENGSEPEFDSSEASEDVLDDPEDFEASEDLEEGALDEASDPTEATEAEPAAPMAVDDLPAFADAGLSEADRERLLAGLSGDVLTTIDEIVDRRLAARLTSVTHANIHLQRAAQEHPELYRLYGAQAQAMLSEMSPDVAATPKGVQMAMLGAIARKVSRTGDLSGAILEAAQALQKSSTPPPARPARPLPPEARTPSPTVGKRPQSGARGNGRASAERVVDALAEMTGASSRAARRYFEEGE